LPLRIDYFVDFRPRQTTAKPASAAKARVAGSGTTLKAPGLPTSKFADANDP
jgi:hypothetical protein